MSENPYSAEKMLWWAAREGYPPRGPKQIHFVICDLCNQDCHFCAYRMSGYSSNELFVGSSERAGYGHDNPKRWIPTDRALGLLDEFYAAGVEGIQFTGGGEPTVHPDHYKIFSAAYDAGFKVALVSNGLRWSKELIDLAGLFSWCRISVDAGTPEMYANVRNTRPESFGKVMRNMAALRDRIDKAGSKCVFGMGYVVTERNWEGIVEGVRQAKIYGAHNVRMSAYFNTDFERRFEPFYKEARDSILEARARYEDDNFKVYDRFGDRVEDLREHSPDYETCYYQSYTNYVGGDIQSYRCCVLAYNKRGVIPGGNLENRRFDEFWASDDRKTDFALFRASECEKCQFNDRNKAMKAVIESDPLHKEFP